MNRVLLVGRLTRDPELRYTNSGKAVVQLGLAVDRRVSRERRDSGVQTADFFNLVAWEKTAETCANYLKKGSRIGVDGRLQSRSYEAKDGTKRTAVEVVIDSFEFLDSKNDAAAPRTDAPGDYNSGYSASPKPSADSFGDMEDEEIPF